MVMIVSQSDTAAHADAVSNKSQILFGKNSHVKIDFSERFIRFIIANLSGHRPANIFG